MKNSSTVLKRIFKLIPIWGIIGGFILIGEAMAQTPVPGGGGSEGAPIDGFTSILLAAGAGYGIHKMRRKTTSVKK